MNTLHGLPILTHYNNLLSTGEEQHARAVIHEFFKFFDEESPKDRLWFLLVMALKSDNIEISPGDRGNMIFFYEYCIALFHAARVLNGHPKRTARRRTGKQPGHPE